MYSEILSAELTGFQEKYTVGINNIVEEDPPRKFLYSSTQVNYFKKRLGTQVIFNYTQYLMLIDSENYSFSVEDIIL